MKAKSKEESTDILISYSNGNTSTHTGILESFDSLIEKFSRLKKRNKLIIFYDFVVNPQYIVTIQHANKEEQ